MIIIFVVLPKIPSEKQRENNLPGKNRDDRNSFTSNVRHILGGLTQFNQGSRDSTMI